MEPSYCKCGRTKNPEYQLCYECYKKQGQTKEKQEGIDLNKKIEIQLWALITVFAAGILIGAWLW